MAACTSLLAYARSRARSSSPRQLTVRPAALARLHVARSREDDHSPSSPRRVHSRQMRIVTSSSTSEAARAHAPPARARTARRPRARPLPARKPKNRLRQLTSAEEVELCFSPTEPAARARAAPPAPRPSIRPPARPPADDSKPEGARRPMPSLGQVHRRPPASWVSAALSRGLTANRYAHISSSQTRAAPPLPPAAADPRSPLSLQADRAPSSGSGRVSTSVAPRDADRREYFLQPRRICMHTSAPVQGPPRRAHRIAAVRTTRVASACSSSSP
jgi:hypothetical protein